MSPRENGFVYLWALFSIALAGVIMAGAAQVWQAKSQRDKEAELLFIGEQFRKAIMSYHNSGTKQYPEKLEDLLQDGRAINVQRHLRKIYLDPITNSEEWGLIEETPANTAAGAAATQNNAASNQRSATNPSSATNPNTTSGMGAASSPNVTPNNPNAAANPSAAASPGLAPNANQTAGAAGQASGSNPATSTSSGMSSNIGKRIIGVYSLSEKRPIKKDQFPEVYAKFSEAKTYQDWKFIYKPGEGAAAKGAASPQNQPSTPGAAPAKGSPFSPQSSQGSSGSSGSSASPFAPQSSPAPAQGASPFGSK
ncbi:hypothetical protein [Nitrosomonas sp.]|uniref:hypothetical protein n=1 Tax=Nitrosomonas sp. TaxID=42353 RepID=UPI0025DC08FC|nr:hypothetical protein [Nitrosomonas sp.]